MWNSVTLEIFLCHGRKNSVTFDISLKTTSHSMQSYLQNSLPPSDLTGSADNSLALASFWQIMGLINRWRPQILQDKLKQIPDCLQWVVAKTMCISAVKELQWSISQVIFIPKGTPLTSASRKYVSEVSMLVFDWHLCHDIQRNRKL